MGQDEGNSGWYSPPHPVMVTERLPGQQNPLGEGQRTIRQYPRSTILLRSDAVVAAYVREIGTAARETLKAALTQDECLQPNEAVLCTTPYLRRSLRLP